MRAGRATRGDFGVSPPSYTRGSGDARSGESFRRQPEAPSRDSRRLKLKRLLVSSLILAVLSTSAYGQITFKNVQTRTTFGAAEQGNKGKLVIEGKQIRFTRNNGAEYFTIPAEAVSELFYSRVSGRRIGAA